MELPLFPLNSVLFPGMPIRLHIFEERYKEMINECIDNQSPFGVVLLQAGKAEGNSLARPYMVGTTAHITQVQRLPDNRMNLLAIGRDRFKVNDLDFGKRAFLVGDVDLMPLLGSDKIDSKSTDKLQPLIEKYLKILSKAGEVSFDINQLPDDALSIIFLAAVLLQAEDSVKQSLLEAEDIHHLLVDLLHLYQKEVALINTLLSPPDAELANDSPFSLN